MIFLCVCVFDDSCNKHKFALLSKMCQRQKSIHGSGKFFDKVTSAGWLPIKRLGVKMSLSFLSFEYFPFYS